MNSFSIHNKNIYKYEKSYLYDWVDTLKKNKSSWRESSKQTIFAFFFKVVPAPYEGGPSMYGSLSWATLPTFESQLFDGGWPAKKGHPWRMQKNTQSNGIFHKNQHLLYSVFLKLWWILLPKGIQIYGCWSWIWPCYLVEEHISKWQSVDSETWIYQIASDAIFPIDFATCKTTFFLRKKSNSLTSVANHPSFGTCCPDIRKDIQRVSYRVDENILMGRTDPIFGTAEDGPVCQSCDGHVMSMWSDEQLLTTCWKKKTPKTGVLFVIQNSYSTSLPLDRLEANVQ